MIDESIGKIIGMAMAYGVSALGLFLAYANYRKRTVKAEKVMTPKAWGVVAAVLLTIGGGVLVVAELAQPPGATSAQEPEPETVAQAPVSEEAPVPTASSTSAEERSNWPLIGMMLPAFIFLTATWITAGLYRHFSAQPHPGSQSESAPGSST